MPTRFGATDTPTLPGMQNPYALNQGALRTRNLAMISNCRTFTCWVGHHEIERNADLLGEVLR
jgi:hypothetical protein